jgi:hypothetical protein
MQMYGESTKRAVAFYRVAARFFVFYKCPFNRTRKYDIIILQKQEQFAVACVE